jgi:CheY-like chemotaxis protein
VSVANSAPTALELIDAEDGFDLILTDVILPGMSGPELANEIKDRHGRVALVFMSGYPDQVLHRHELPTAAPLLPKPFGATDVLDLVGSILNRAPH